MRVTAFVLFLALAPAAFAAGPPCTVTLSGAINGTRPCSVDYTDAVPTSWTLTTAEGNSPFEFHALLGTAKPFAPGVYTLETLNGGVNASNPAADKIGMMWTASAAKTLGRKTYPAVGQVKLTLTAVGAEGADCHGGLTATMVPKAVGGRDASQTVTVVAKF